MAEKYELDGGKNHSVALMMIANEIAETNRINRVRFKIDALSEKSD